MQAPLALWSAEAYMEQQPTRLYVLGMIYGVLLVMLVYNLFIYLSVRDVSYLYYILYIASFGFYQVSVNGAGVAYFWPDSPGGRMPRRRCSLVPRACSVASSPGISCNWAASAVVWTGCCSC